MDWTSDGIYGLANRRSGRRRKRNVSGKVSPRFVWRGIVRLPDGCKLSVDCSSGRMVLHPPGLERMAEADVSLPSCRCETSYGYWNPVSVPAREVLMKRRRQSGVCVAQLFDPARIAAATISAVAARQPTSLDR